MADPLPAPGLPHPSPMLSFWLANTRASPLLGLRSSEVLPTEAELVVVGSGLSGVATVYFLLTAENSPYRNKPGSIVMLEAREACSGATGRNGGHCRPDTYLGYPDYKKAHGKAHALALIQMELDNLDFLMELITTKGIACDFWRGEGATDGGMDVFMSESIKASARNALKEYEADGGTIKNVWIESVAEAVKASRIGGAIGAATYPAGQLYPFKLVEHLLLECLSLGLSFHSTTPVLSVSASPSPQWIVTTSRGTISTNKILYATNAFTPTLLPELKGHFQPVLGHCSSATPTPSFSGAGRMRFTQCIRWGREVSESHGQHEKFEYMIQRPSDGTIIIGGGAEVDPNGVTDDSQTMKIHEDYLRRYNAETYLAWGEEKPGEGTFRVWTGIMADTPDYLPFVGPLPGKPGAFVFAGHNGHGMARIPLCSNGLAKLILAGPDADFSVSGLPPPLACTKERLRRKPDTLP